jgi:hypothetical protein
MRRLTLVFVSLLMISASACSGAPPAIATPTRAPAKVATPASMPAKVALSSAPAGKQFEDLDPNSFSRSTTINNEWFPLKPGMQSVFEGYTDEGGQAVHHRVLYTVTDLTKVIGGVRTVVAWVVDYSNDQLIEKEVCFYAQDNDGTVWYLGEHPEVYKDGEFVEAPTWIHGLEGALAGIKMKAKPQLGMPTYSSGWGPGVDFTDRALIYQMGQRISVPFGNYGDTLVIAESSQSEPNAWQLKSFARGVGTIRIGWSGADATRETLELVDRVQLSPEALAQIRTAALELEKHAYEISKDVYGRTPPAESK